MPPEHAEAVVTLERVSLAFTLPVLRDISLQIPTGELLAVVGESGTGKSTLLRLLLGLLTPDAGRVTVFGADVQRQSPAALHAMRSRIGMVFQGAALFDSLSTYENVAFALRERDGLSEREIAARVGEVLTAVDLDAARVAPLMPAALSGGMRKRVGIARALAARPDLLLYDEPTAGLDPITGHTVTALMQRLQHELHVTSIVVSHDVRAMMRIADRVALLHEGRFAFLGAPDVMRASDDVYTRQFLAVA
jgi:phospholipid/cholesterol/gamma-HCH transport system ATP-binding protein